MTKKLSIAIAAGLLLAGPAFADDQEETKTETQEAVKDPAKDQTRDRIQARDGSGLGAQVREQARDQAKGDGTTGIGEQVREQARFHGCEQSGSAECQAHHAVHGALAEKAEAPAGRPALPAEAGTRAAEHAAMQARHTEVERAAMRHTERMAAGEPKGEAQATRRGAGGAGHGMMGGQGQGGGQGPGSGDCTQAAETMRRGSGGMGPGGGTGSGGGMH